MSHTEAMTIPRALLYVETVIGGAACWVNEIRTIEDNDGGGCTIWLHADFADENIAIESPWSTQQVIDALRDIQNRLPGAICVPRVVETAKAEEHPSVTVTVCDALTGIRVKDIEHPAWWWWSGPGRNDRGRGTLFGEDPATYAGDTLFQQKRYVVVAVSNGAPPAAELNTGYPADLLARFDIPSAEVTP